jgi:RHS repeat-associated protein
MTWRYDACQGPVTLAEFDASAAMTRWYVRGLGVAQGIGDVVAEVDVTGATAKPHYYLSNHRGDTLVVLNPDGADNSTFRYDAFGKCYAATGPFTPRYTFSTKEFLPQAQLYLYQHRLYDVAAGRWTQRDPIDYQDSINLYQFCGNNPVNWLDEAGLITETKGSEQFCIKVAMAKLKLKSKPQGKKILEELEKSKNTFVIEESKDGNTATPSDSKKASDGTGTGGTIKFNPNNTQGGKDKKGSKLRPPYVGLAHELGHASAYNKGKRSTDKGNGQPGTTPPSEQQSLKAENKVRVEHGLQPRPSYYE